MAIHLVNAAVKMPPFSVSPAGSAGASQPQLYCYGRIKSSASSSRKTALDKFLLEEESFFSIPSHRQNNGVCFQTKATVSEYVDSLHGPETICAEKTVRIQPMLERYVNGENGQTHHDISSFLTDIASPLQKLGGRVFVENQLLEIGSSVTDACESYSSNNVTLYVPLGGKTPLPKGVSSAGEVMQVADAGNLMSTSKSLLEDVNSSVPSSLLDNSSNDSPMPTDLLSSSPHMQSSHAEGLQPATKIGFHAASSSISGGDTVVNVLPVTSEKGMEMISDSQVANDTFHSVDSAVKSISDTISDTPEFTSESLQKTKDIVNFSVERTKTTIDDFISMVKESIDTSVNAASNAAKNTYYNINTSILKSMKSVTGSFENTISGLFPKVDNTGGLAHDSTIDFMSPFQMGTPANNAIKKFVVVVEDSTGSALATATNLVIEAYRSTKALLPPETQSTLQVSEEKALEIIKPLVSSLQQVNATITNIEKALGVDPENPIVPVILVVGGTIFVGISYWGFKYGGYSGDLTPKLAADLLRKEGNAVLIDIRPQELKESEGVPDLRRGDRFKFAGVELPKVEGSIRKLLKNANEIDDVLIAAVIRNLKIVNGGTKVIIMDANGIQSKKVARVLRKLGIKRSYRLQGGFQSWRADGLRIKQLKTETPLTILKEETEAILEEVKPTTGAIFLACVGFVAAIYVLVEWEKALQLIGFIGLGQVIYTRVNSYESSEDLKADVRALLSPFQSATQGVLWIARQVEPNKLQLATTPSTIAVQNRVLQAAAKHGSLSSELEQTQDTEPAGDSTIISENFETTS